MPTILTTDDAHAATVAKQLLDAAGDDAHRVRTNTSGKRVAFDVDDELARAAGFVIDDDSWPDNPKPDHGDGDPGSAYADPDGVLEDGPDTPADGDAEADAADGDQADDDAGAGDGEAQAAPRKPRARSARAK